MTLLQYEHERDRTKLWDSINALADRLARQQEEQELEERLEGHHPPFEDDPNDT